ncbi:hypothetical protein D4764_08G0000060 [Takifugu flavidus]|uniref:Uncharacterized protein n=1 Tax=Takifugu flavidus TaxID=433684 RepID=A0A5C6MMM6_9TELE|nr:hypothetical protein D4764_08G0000060 [Takifugu flavidus]
MLFGSAKKVLRATAGTQPLVEGVFITPLVDQPLLRADGGVCGPAHPQACPGVKGLDGKPPCWHKGRKLDGLSYQRDCWKFRKSCLV